MPIKFIIAYFGSILLEFWFNLCAYSANHNNIPLGVFANLTYPFISSIPIVLLVEEKGWKAKMKMALAEGIGYGTGTFIFLSFIKQHLDNF